VQKKKEILASLAVTPQTGNVPATVCDKYLVKIEKALTLWMEDMSRKRVPTESSVLCYKALSLQDNSGKGSPKMRGTKPSTASKRSRN
jgi:hypothetical protein